MTAAIKKINMVAFSHTALFVIVFGLIFMSFVYIYFVNVTVWHVASRQKIDDQLSDMTTKISSLESKYVELTSNVNIDNAYKLGFKDTTSDQMIFVKRSATLGALSMRQVQ